MTVRGDVSQPFTQGNAGRALVGRRRCVVRAGGGRAGRVRRHPRHGDGHERRRACPASRSPSPASSARRSTSVVTNESGLYVKERLIPGTYEVKAELAGFKTAVVPQVLVSVDAQTPVDFKLEVGAAHRNRRSHRRIAAAQDRPRRRGDDIRSASS